MRVPRFVVELPWRETVSRVLRFVTNLTPRDVAFFAKSFSLRKAFLSAVPRTANNACKTFATASDLDVVASFFFAEICSKFFRVAEVALEVGELWRTFRANHGCLPFASEMDFVPAEALETSLAAVAFLFSPSLARFAHHVVILL